MSTNTLKLSKLAKGWKTVSKEEFWPELLGEILSNPNNDGGNNDEHLIIIRSCCGAIKLITDYDEKELSEIVLEVRGKWEIDGISSLFARIAPKQPLSFMDKLRNLFKKSY